MSQDLLQQSVDVLVKVVESAGALIIVVGALVAFYRLVVHGLRHRNTDVFIPLRLSLGRFLTLGLEFQLAGDVLRTALAPNFREIGQLAAVASIRTLLNYFLSREIREEREDLRRQEDSSSATPTMGRRC